MPRLSCERDRGAVSSLVVILLATGVLLGMTAMVVDVGRLYAEREELQAGADSAAMSVALDCAKRRLACETQGLATSETAADANASDGRANVVELCGWAVTPVLPGCTADDNDNLTDCLSSPPTGVDYVQVRTRTEVAPGEFVLPFAFAQTMAGINTGATVGACSRVAYGPPRSAFVMPISACEYERTIANQVSAPPWISDPAPGREVMLGIHPLTHPICGVPPPPGWDVPAGIGRLNANGVNCSFLTEPDLEYNGPGGTSPSRACRTRLRQLRASHEVIALAIYDGERPAGSRTEYHLYKLAAFVVTGYSLPGVRSRSNIHSSFHPCTMFDRCIYGYFVDVDFLPGEVGPDPGADLGLLAVKTIG